MLSTNQNQNQTWQTEPPYAIADGTREDYAALRGQCHCKQVEWGFRTRKPLDAKYCHCTNCQKLHGAPFQWAAIFHKNDVLFYNGTRHLSFYNSENNTREHDLPCKVSCTLCGAPIMDEGRNMCLVFPTLISEVKTDREAFNDFQPSCHIFYGSRVVDVNDGRPKWSGHKV